MALRANIFEKMIRGNNIIDEKSYEKESIDMVRFNELEGLKQRIFVNSLSHIKDNVLREKCSNITTHYRLFKNDESHFIVEELSNNEKDELNKCIEECIQAECSKLINEKESIPKDLLQLMDTKLVMPDTLNEKLNNMLSLLNKYTINKNEINNSIFKLLDSSYINVLEAQKLAEQVNVVKANLQKLQSNIISQFSCSNEFFESLVKYYNSKEKEYATNLAKLEQLKELQDKYKLIDGPQYRALVKKFIQTQEIIKVKTDMFNSYIQ